MAKYTQTTSVSLSCPVCSSERVVKMGKRNGYQRYLCRECRKSFQNSGNTPGGRFPPEQTGAAVSMFYSGMSYKQIAENMEDMFDIDEPSTRAIYEWVRKYTKAGMKEMADHPVTTSGHWVADEMVVTVGGERYWHWNVMCEDTRYVLASYLSKKRDTRAATAAMRRAAAASAEPPKTIKTDKLRSYNRAIANVFPDAKHIKSEGLAAELNNNRSERLQGTYRQRTKTLRGLDTRESGQLYLDGWTLNYNLFRKHDALGNKTPAQAAGLDVPFDEWQDVVEHAAPHKRAQIEVVVVDERLSDVELDVSVYEDSLKDLPPVERKSAKSKRERKASVNGRTAFKSNAPKAQAVAKTARNHPYLSRSEARRG